MKLETPLGALVVSYSQRTDCLVGPSTQKSARDNYHQKKGMEDAFKKTLVTTLTPTPPTTAPLTPVLIVIFMVGFELLHHLRPWFIWRCRSIF